MLEENKCRRKKRINWILIILIILFNEGCTIWNNKSPTRDSDKITLSPTKVVPSTVFQTKTLPISSPQPTKTMTPLEVISITFSTNLPPTQTSLPTMPSNGNQEIMLELLMYNAYCELPCWWGIIPGETSWKSAQQFLDTFVDEILQGSSSTTTKNGIEYLHTNYSINIKVEGYQDRVSSLFSVTNGIIEGIEVRPYGTELRYQLHHVLKLFGKPDEVLIRILPDTPAGTPWFTFKIFYIDRGIIVLYDGAAILDADEIKVCPEGLSPKLILIPPNRYDLDKMKRFTSDYSTTEFISLKNADEMDIDTFYNKMKEINSCLPAKSISD